MNKTALITGITGQDGAYLCQLLLEQGYEVHGLRQPVAVPDLGRLETLLGADVSKLHLHYADLTDSLSISRLIEELEPDEIYNLAAQSHVHISFEVPDLTLQVNGAGCGRILDAIKQKKLIGKTKFFQASTSELFGDASPPQMEATPLAPRSPYAAAKLYAYHMTKIYREAYGMFSCNGIMFNHESPLRGEEFVTRKIAIAVARIIHGEMDILMLGNLDARRDWSHARDIMQGAWMMLQMEQPEDFVLSSGKSFTVREFVNEAFLMAGVSIAWEGAGLEEKGIDQSSGRTLVQVDPVYFRPLEVENLMGCADKAKSSLGWQAETPFAAIVREMVLAELQGGQIASPQELGRLYG